SGGKPSFALEKKGDDWQLLRPTESKADKPQVTALLSNLKYLRAKTVPSEKLDLKEAAKYGLDKPAAAITLTLGGANARTRVLFSSVKAAGGSEQHYAHIDGNGPVLELSESGAKKIDLKPVELRDKTVLAFERDQIKKIKLSATGKDFILLEKKKKEDGA